MTEHTGESYLAVLAGFCAELRAAGITVGTGDVVTYTAAASLLDPSDLVDLYWAGRITLLTRRDQQPTYDRVFHRFFLGAPDDPDRARFTPAAVAAAESVLELPEAEPGQEPGEEQPARLGLIAADAATLKAKAFAACTPDELAAIRRLMRTIRLTPPRRRGRRTTPTRSRGRLDVRRTVRESLRRHGDPAELFRRRRRWRLRPLIIILDVSGSMADYSRALLQFAYSVQRAAPRVEVFCFGTRLTRLTRELDHRRVDDAFERAARAVVDWEGGTRIGASLGAFVRDWGPRGISRGGIVVICSDGLDRGDPAVLDAAMARLARQCHAIVWLHPHHAAAGGFRPSTLGMMVAAPHVDLIASGQDLAGLEDFATRLASLR